MLDVPLKVYYYFFFFFSCAPRARYRERETIYLSGEYIEMLTEERQSCPLCAAAVVVPVTGEPHPTAQHHDKINCRLVRRGRTCLFLFFSLVQWPPTSRVVDEIHVISTLVGPFCLTHPPGPARGSHAMRWSLLMGQVEN